MDEHDWAQDMAAAERDAAVSARRLAAAREARQAGRTDCVDCGAVIPPGRLAALPQAVRCTDCAAAREMER